MTDDQLSVRLFNKRVLTISVILFLISIGLAYYWVYTNPAVKAYEQQISKEASLQSQIDILEDGNNLLRSSIEQTGKELISFSENKIKYINLASEMSEQYELKINKLSVSDVWEEGQMSGMTTEIEVEGSLPDITKFINSYCGINYTNRINVVSCRPSGRFPWLVRKIDGQNVLGWFDISAEEQAHVQFLKDEETMLNRAATEAGLTYSGNSTDTLVEKDPSITLNEMFSQKVFKVYLKIDFLGRS